MKTKHKKFCSFIQSLAGKTVALYGAGDIGEYTIKLLTEYIMPPHIIFVDDNLFGGNFLDKEIISFDELIELDRCEEIVLVITCTAVHTIYERLKLRGMRGQIFASKNYLDEDGIHVFSYESESYNTFLNDVYKVCSRLSDSVSKEILNILAKARITFSPVEYIEAMNKSISTSGANQYFIKEVFERLIERKVFNFIDCGAFDGDTIQDIVNLGIPLTAAYCFEPDKENFFNLNKYIIKSKLEVCVKTFQKGVGASNMRLRFNAINTGCSSVSSNGISVIDIVTLDNFLGNVQVDMIKMDIEGSEMNAILGAMNMIQRERPILAISIYHNFNDLVRIPLFLMDHLESYYFYIRHHYGVRETVLYCLPQKA